MPSIDVVDVLERLNVEYLSTSGDEVRCLCPEHEAFVGRISSHPNWTCNINNGKTYCRTEPRGSNLLWTVTRMLDCTPREAVEFMTGRADSNLQGAAILGKITKMRRGAVKEYKDPVRLDDIEEDLVKRYISDACYNFFTHPPNKTPTNITRETVDRYKVFERRWGYYGNRTIIPFFMHDRLVGFCAVDLLGEKQWLMEHPLSEEKDYRKTLYPLNFRGKECLFGYDDVSCGCSQLFVSEGAREVMKITQEGFPNAVGCLKATLSDEQVLLITKKAPEEIILFFDGDEAGWSATDKNAKKLERVSRVRRCYLPIGADPKNLCAQDIKNLVKKSKLT